MIPSWPYIICAARVVRVVCVVESSASAGVLGLVPMRYQGVSDHCLGVSDVLTELAIGGALAALVWPTGTLQWGPLMLRRFWGIHSLDVAWGCIGPPLARD
jgi:hypothetical protein